MIIEIVTLVITAILLIIGLIWARKTIKKNLAIKEQIPQEELDLFNEVERRWEESRKNGNTNPYKILFDTIREKRNSSTPRVEYTTTQGDNKGTGNRELQIEPIRREIIQDRNVESITGDKGGSGQLKPNSTKNFWARFRGNPNKSK